MGELNACGKFLDDVYSKANKAGKDYGILAPPTTAQDGLDVLRKHFLGDGWYTVNPLSTEQVNTEVVAEILMKYPDPLHREKLRDRVKRFFRNII
jgi:hypothetical protein